MQSERNPFTVITNSLSSGRLQDDADDESEIQELARLLSSMKVNKLRDSPTKSMNP